MLSNREIDWPAATPWTMPDDRFSPYSGPIGLGSLYRLGLDLNVAREVYQTEVSVSFDLHDLTAVLNPNLGPPPFGLTTGASTLIAKTAEVTITGTGSPTIRHDRFTTWAISGMTPGDYEVRASHPLNQFDADDVIEISIPDLPPPGMPAMTDEFGRTETTGQLTGVFPGNRDAQWYTPRSFIWIEAEGMYREFMTGCGGDFFTGYDDVPGMYFRSTALPGNRPATWYLYDGEDGWASGSITGGDDPIEVVVNCGGPSDSFTGSGPAFAPNISMTLEVVDSTGMAMTGVPVSFGGGAWAHGETRAVTELPFFDETTLPGWTISTQDTTITSAQPATGTIRVVVTKTFEVTGTVVGTGGRGIGSTRITMVTPSGRRFDEESTNTDGTFRLTSPSGTSVQPVLITVNAPGYLPYQRLFTPDPMADALTDQMITLTPTPGPTIGDIRLDRAGMFLPGVLQSGDPEGFNPNNARGTLTATFEADVTPTTLSYMVDRFTSEGGGSGTVSREDPVQRVFLLDPRRFAASPEQTDTDEPTMLDLSTIDLASWTAIESAARTNTDAEGSPSRVLLWSAEQGESNWQGQVELWNLPPGQFEPYIVAVSAQGGVSVRQYSPPAGRPALRGARIPEWASVVLNIIGTIDATGGTDVINSVLAGVGFEPSGGFSTAIGERPGTDDGGTYQTVTYDYRVDLTVKNGQDGPQGLLALGPNFIGITVKGNVRFIANGAAGTVTISGGGGLDLDSGELLGDLFSPGIMRGFPVRPINPTVSGSFSLDNIVALGEDGTTFASYRLQRTATANIKGRHRHRPHAARRRHPRDRRAAARGAGDGRQARGHLRARCRRDDPAEHVLCQSRAAADHGRRSRAAHHRPRRGAGPGPARVVQPLRLGAHRLLGPRRADQPQRRRAAG